MLLTMRSWKRFFWSAWEKRDAFLRFQKDEDLDYYFTAGAEPYNQQLCALCDAVLAGTK